QDPQLRRLLLYPAELRNQLFKKDLILICAAKLLLFFIIAKFFIFSAVPAVSAILWGKWKDRSCGRGLGV
ncbi:MAG: hypothetical protein J1E97_05090, partial [Muribaculaceae bacterium]|nr:hypothetical protein [Muribaculaceae bacterium]